MNHQFVLQTSNHIIAMMWVYRFIIIVFKNSRQLYIFLCTGTPQELQQMLQELDLFNESRQLRLKMNIAKENMMVVDSIPINVNNVLI